LLALLLLVIAAAPASALKISVKGNHLVDAKGKTVRLIGINRSGSEYSCSGDDGQGGHGYDFFQGPVSDKAIDAMKTWKVNAIALPLNEACWLGGIGGLNPQFTGENYRAAIEDFVNRLNAHGIYVVLRLSGAAPGNNAYGAVPGDTELPMADADHSLDFWQSVATRFAGNPAVLFHAYDEPHKVTWECVYFGCTVDANGDDGEPVFGPYDAVGHQAIVDTIRGTGATQPIIISGIDFAGQLDQWQDFVPADPANSIVVGWNSFDYSGNFDSSKPYLKSLSKSYPIVFGGFGDTDCNSDYSNKLMKFADGKGISYLAWTWNTEADYGGCANALLGPDESAYLTGHPSGFGKGVRKHFLQVQKKHRHHH
jgi:endoglucanase